MPAAPVAELPPTAAAVAPEGSAPPPKTAARAETVIPLLPVPDDPGPDPSHDTEPEPAPPGGSRGFGLFK
jgi:hypothetical protein